MQQINLYQAQFQPTEVILPPRQVFLIVILFITVLSVISLYSQQKNSILEKSIHQQQQHTLSNIGTSTVSPLLDSELHNLERQQQKKKMLLDYLTQQSFGNSQGFSKTLRTLSQQKINNVWLTSFSLLDGGQTITLHGEALQSSQIPLYIDSLGKSPHFHGKQFSVFQLQQPEDNATRYTFKLHSEQKTGSQ
ncbi:MAG: PilN domain-containing protein [Gammaproteobacteria bacterium]|nr:PilN domain-containing protein [Gammaproteobacteria bacterium]